MIYTANITTPKNTAQTSLKQTIIGVTKGLVYKVEFDFPTGSVGLMGVAVFDGSYQVWPSNAGKFFTGNGVLLSWDDMFLMDSAPYEFQCYTYNEDDTYDHLVAVRIGLVSKDVFLARFLPYKSSDYFVELLAKMVDERAARAVVQKEELVETPFEWLLRQEVEE